MVAQTRSRTASGFFSRRQRATAVRAASVRPPPGALVRSGRVWLPSDGGARLRPSATLHATGGLLHDGDPGNLRLLPRLGRGAGRRRRDRRGGAGGALHAARSTTPTSRSTRSTTACEQAGLEPEQTRLRRLLRQAAAEVRAAARDLPRLRPARLPLVRQGDAAVAASRSCTCRARSSRGLQRRVSSKRYVFTEHHESHAASAFFPSPFEEAAILTLDGVGEWATASFGVGRGNRIELTPASCASRTRSGCSTRRSPTSPASRSTPASTS